MCTLNVYDLIFVSSCIGEKEPYHDDFAAFYAKARIPLLDFVP
jgi:hypothetical protein